MQRSRDWPRFLSRSHISVKMDDTTSMLVSQIRLADRKFRRACSQVILLNNKIQMLKVRYDRAKSDGRRSFRYGWRLQLATYEGVRNMFYEYAAQRCDEMEQLQDKLRAQTGMEYEDFSDTDDDEPPGDLEDAEESGEENPEEQTP